MKPFWLVYVLIIASLMFVAFANANTVGFSYDRAVNEDSWGIYGDYQEDFNEYSGFELDGQLQGGDVIFGNLDLALTFGMFRLESNNLLKGYEIDSIGRKNNLGLSGVVNLGDFEVSVGIFGVNGNPFDTVYELENPTDPNSVVEKDAGISIKEGSTLNAALKTEFSRTILNRDFEIALRGLFEVAGDPETDKAHQLEANISTGGTLINSLNWTAQARISAQLWGDLIQHDSQIMTGVEFPF